MANSISLSRPSRLWGPQPLSFFASTEAPAASSASTTSRWPLKAAKCSGPEPRSGGCRWRWQGFRRISDLKNWEFGHVWSTILTETCITAHRNQDQLIGKSHLCCAIHCKPDQRFTITHYNLSKKSLESIASICHN